MSGEQLMRAIGKSGVAASAVGLGTWAIGGWMWGGTDEKQSIAAIQASLDAGVTPDRYGARLRAWAVRRDRRQGTCRAPRQGGHRHQMRSRLAYAERHGISSIRTESRSTAILAAMRSFTRSRTSLKRLGTDYIDLYITHWQDPTTPIEETMRALEDLRSSGKIRAIGASNVSPAELNAYIATGSLDAIQERFSMIDREIETDLLPLTRQNGISTLSYSSLALGLLSGTIDPDRVFSGDDQRKDNPRFSVANRLKATRRLPKRSGRSPTSMAPALPRRSLPGRWRRTA